MPDTLTRRDRPDITAGTRNVLAARYYAAIAARRGECHAADLAEAGFRAGHILDHWSTIRAAGERLLARINRKVRP